MTQRLLVFLSVLFFVSGSYSQKQNVTIPFFSSPSWGMKTNFLYDATTTFNLGTEFKVGSKYTLDLSANYNPWTFSGNKKLKHFLVQPELRRWICEPFNGHFWGVHALYAHYNVGGIEWPFSSKQLFKEKRYQGDLYGAGISYGYQWYLSPRWNLEATVGLGYIYMDYSAYPCKTCGEKLYQKDKHYLGPTKVGVALIYIIK